MVFEFLCLFGTKVGMGGRKREGGREGRRWGAVGDEWWRLKENTSSVHTPFFSFESIGYHLKKA